MNNNYDFFPDNTNMKKTTSKNISFWVFVISGVFFSFLVIADCFTQGLVGTTYSKALVACMMFYAASDVNELFQTFEKYINIEKPMSALSRALHILSGVFFLLWMSS